jgi:rod shape-determining protein MreB
MSLVFGDDLAIDLGTSNTLIYQNGKGVIVREPTVVSRSRQTKALLAVGSEAKKMLGKNPAAVEVIRPLKAGVIADFDAAAAMLKHYLTQINEHAGWLSRLLRPRVLMGIPSGVTEVEKRAVRDAALTAGARQALLVEEPLAAALGAGIDIVRPEGNLVVDCGGGTTEIAVISLSGIVVSRSLQLAGQAMDRAIINAVRLSHGLLLGEATAEAVKISIGSAAALAKEKACVARGRDMGKGLPRSVKLQSVQIREILAPVVQEISAAVTDILEETPPELTADILERGIVLTGAASQLPGLDRVLSEATKIPVGLADSPGDAVVKGLAKLLTNRRLLEAIRLRRGL